MAIATSEPASPKLRITRNIALLSGAVAAVPAGRAVDRLGRIPVLAAGFDVAVARCGLAALGSAHDSALLILTAGRGGDRERATLLATGAVVLVTIPALWILRCGPRRHASQLDNDRRRRHRCISTRGRLNLETTR
jgi:MFS family permease